MTIDWENLKKEDLYENNIYESISNIQDSAERFKQEQLLFGVAKKYHVKSEVDKVYKNHTILYSCDFYHVKTQKKLQKK